MIYPNFRCAFRKRDIDCYLYVLIRFLRENLKLFHSNYSAKSSKNELSTNLTYKKLCISFAITPRLSFDLLRFSADTLCFKLVFLKI